MVKILVCESVELVLLVDFLVPVGSITMGPIVPVVVPSLISPCLPPAISGLPVHPLPVPPTPVLPVSVPPDPIPSVPVPPVPILPDISVPPGLLPLLVGGNGDLLSGKAVLGYHGGAHGGSTGGVQGVQVPLKMG